MIFAPAAVRDLQRLREFLRPKNVEAARRAGESCDTMSAATSSRSSPSAISGKQDCNARHCDADLGRP